MTTDDILEELKLMADMWDDNEDQEMSVFFVRCIGEIRKLRIARDRYEVARRLNPRQWADAWKLNLSSGKPFDEIIDELRPFMFPQFEEKPMK